MKKENYEISSQYIRDLKLLLKNKNSNIKPYDIAHASFRKNNSDLIIKNVNKIDFIITYLDGTKQKFTNYNKLMRMTKNLNDLYPKNRRDYISRYFKIVNAFHRHRKSIKNKIKSTSKSLINRLTPQQVKELVSQI